MKHLIALLASFCLFGQLLGCARGIKSDFTYVKWPEMSTIPAEHIANAFTERESVFPLSATCYDHGLVVMYVMATEDEPVQGRLSGPFYWRTSSKLDTLPISVTMPNKSGAVVLKAMDKADWYHDRLLFWGTATRAYGGYQPHRVIGMQGKVTYVAILQAYETDRRWRGRVQIEVEDKSFDIDVSLP